MKCKSRPPTLPLHSIQRHGIHFSTKESVKRNRSSRAVVTRKVTTCGKSSLGNCNPYRRLGTGRMGSGFYRHQIIPKRMKCSLYLAYNAPHWPWNATPDDFRKYRGKSSQGWHELARQRLDKQKKIGLFAADTIPAPVVDPRWDNLSDKQRDRLDAVMAAYAGCIDRVDQNVGKLVALLKQENQFDNTVIVFLTDNGACQEGGPMGQGDESMVLSPPLETIKGVHLGLNWANTCNTPFRKYKHFLHEGGACTPMIAHWPAGIPKAGNGEFVRQFAYLPDWMATEINDLASSEPQRVQRMSPQWETWATETGVQFPDRFNMYQHLQERKSR